MNNHRPYRMRKRAELEAQTRQRIIESAVELHGTVGPARTTISALAERAGVQRATVYRHFPDEAAIYAACSSHWEAQNPFPDLAEWAAIENVEERLERALLALYGHYRRNERMMTNLLRDEGAVPVLARTLAGYWDYLEAAREILLAGRPAHGPIHRLLSAAHGHFLAFPTWRSLALVQRLSDREIAQLMTHLIGHLLKSGEDATQSKADR